MWALVYAFLSYGRCFECASCRWFICAYDGLERAALWPRSCSQPCLVSCVFSLLVEVDALCMLILSTRRHVVRRLNQACRHGCRSYPPCSSLVWRTPGTGVCQEEGGSAWRIVWSIFGCYPGSWLLLLSRLVPALCCSPVAAVAILGHGDSASTYACSGCLPCLVFVTRPYALLPGRGL